MTINQSFDGDGLRAKWVENGVVTYHLRSSALGGQTVTEINQSGQKVRGYVYAGGSAIAKQEGGQVFWDHRDVTGVSNRLTNSSGAVTSRIETDPLGTKVDDTQTYNYNGGGNGYVNGIGFYGDPVLPNMGCSVDGVPADCNWVQRQVNNGVAVPCPNNDCGPRAATNPNTGTTQLYSFNANAAGRGIGTFGVGLGFLPTGVNFVGNGFTVAAGRSAVFSGMGTIVDAPASRTAQFYSLNQIEILVPWSRSQQNVTPIDTGRIMGREEVSSLVDDAFQLFQKRPACEDWTNKLLAELNAATGFNAGSIGDILNNFRASGIVFSHDDSVGGTGSGAYGTSQGYPAIDLYYGATSEYTVVVFLHELVHWAGSGRYSDAKQAAAWNKLAVVISADEYRNKFPDWVASQKRLYGHDGAESSLAAAAQRIACLDEKNLVRTLP